MTNLFYAKFRDAEGVHEPITLHWDVVDSELARFWQECLTKQFLEDGNISNNHPLEKSYCFQAWQRSWDDTDYTRNLNVLCDQMNQAIAWINEDTGLKEYPHIDLHFSKDKLRNHNQVQDYMNQIHHHFENLIGQVWNPAEWMKKAGPKAQLGIRMINNLCHEIEGNLASINDPDKGGVFLSFSGSRHDGEKHQQLVRYDLEDKHYDGFIDEKANWGDITAYYSQLGKTHSEVFHDKDEHIDKTNISGIRYMTGECILSFRAGLPPGTSEKRLQEPFLNWLQEHGWDPKDKTLALGTGKLAKINLDILGMDWQELNRRVKKCDDIYEIGFQDQELNIIHKRTFDYTWRDQWESIVGQL